MSITDSPETPEPPAEPTVVRDRDEVELSTGYRAPNTDLERSLARLWADRLGVRPVGLDDDFFELGGHSLLAAEILAVVADSFGVTVSAKTLFLSPTITDLAAAIDDGRTESEVAR